MMKAVKKYISSTGTNSTDDFTMEEANVNVDYVLADILATTAELNKIVNRTAVGSSNDPTAVENTKGRTEQNTQHILLKRTQNSDT